MSLINFEKPKITIDEVVHVAQQYSQGHVKKMVYAGGVPNVTFIVEFDSGDPIALRVGNVGYTREAHLKFEVDVLSHLERLNFTWSPHLVPLLDGSGYVGSWRKFPTIAMKAIAGVAGDKVSVTTQLCAEIGKAIGELRLALLQYKGFIPPCEDFWSRSERLLSELQLFSEKNGWDIAPSLVIDAFTAAKESVLTIGYPDELVHSDVWPPNIIVLDGRLNGIIDFDDLAIGPGILDLAASISEFGFDRESDILLEQNVGAIIQGFNRIVEPITHEAGLMILPLIEASYCSWFAGNAIHQASFAESELYYRRLNKLRNSSERERLEKNLRRIIINAT